MATVQTFKGFDKLAGKKVTLQGKFSYAAQPRLKGMIEAQGGTVVEALDKNVDYLVLPDLAGGKTVQAKAASLNGKGAEIQVMDAEAMARMLTPSQADLVGLVHAGGAAAAKTFSDTSVADAAGFGGAPAGTISGENFDGIDLRDFSLEGWKFEGCSFVGARINRLSFDALVKCDLRGADAKGDPATFGTIFGGVEGCVFAGAELAHAEFAGHMAGADFSGAHLAHASLSDERLLRRRGKRMNLGLQRGVNFAQADLRKATFGGLLLEAPNFEGADLRGAVLSGCHFDQARFQGANLEGASIMGCKLKAADFSGANLRSANFVDTELSGAVLKGADVHRCGLRGATMTGVDLTVARNNGAMAPMGTVGTALRALDGVVAAARRVHVTFMVRGDPGEEGENVGIDSNGLQHGWGVRYPDRFGRYLHMYAQASAGRMAKTFSDGMLALAGAAGNRQVRYETVEVSTTKAPKQGKELRELVLKGIAEAFAQPAPAEEELAKATKAYREKEKAKGAAERAARDKARAQAKKSEEKEKKQIEKKIEKQVGKVTDIATFLKALELRADKEKIKKATSMLKASGFQLFNDVTDMHMAGVVKSQTDADLVYACRISSDGKYACCTQNLNICGGLRGSICKHLLVLIVGLVKAEKLDPAVIDAWVAKTTSVKPELDKEVMGEIFIRYKGAEAGEVDWRPTETMPEDYYAL